MVSSREFYRIIVKTQAADLGRILGLRLVAYICGARSVDVITEKGYPADDEIQARLEVAYKYAKLVAQRVGNEAAQAWFMGWKENALPQGMSPARFLREGKIDELDGEMRRAVIDSLNVGVL